MMKIPCSLVPFLAWLATIPTIPGCDSPREQNTANRNVSADTTARGINEASSCSEIIGAGAGLISGELKRLSRCQTDLDCVLADFIYPPDASPGHFFNCKTCAYAINKTLALNVRPTPRSPYSTPYYNADHPRVQEIARLSQLVRSKKCFLDQCGAANCEREVVARCGPTSLCVITR